MISVIIPVFNTKKYLSRCLDSIINQTYKNLEIIIIDDGSTDGSEKICDEYAFVDGRISVIHKKNEGLVAARKQGVSIAKYNYISFVDSDDWIELNMFEELFDLLDINETTDLVTSNIIMDKENGSFNKVGSIPAGLYGKSIADKIIPNMMRNAKDGSWGIIGSAVGKIYKKDLLLDVINRIDNGITYGEDDAIVFGYIPRCSKIYICEKCFYHYRIHSGSMATSYNIESFSKIKLLKDYFEVEFTKLGIWEQQKREVNVFVMMFMMQAMKTVFGLDMGYQFPFGLIPQNSNIVLYGAGAVGKCYYNSLQNSDYCNVVLWVDKNYKKIIEEGYPVDAPFDIKNAIYDYIVVALEGEQNYEKIKTELVGLGISESKILWKEAQIMYV